MGSVKLKFRCSTRANVPGILYYQVIHRRIVRQKKTDFQIYPHEWDESSSKIILPSVNTERRNMLLAIINTIRKDMKRFQDIMENLELLQGAYTSDEVIMQFSDYQMGISFLEFMQETINQLKALGRFRTAETYQATYSSFSLFLSDNDIAMGEMDEELLMTYEAFLKRKGVSPNTSSFYMRNLRAVYNRAVEKGVVTQRFPFKRVYTGIEKTLKRAIPLNTLKLIKNLKLPKKPHIEFARDMFLFSFYTRGMSFIDMAFLRKKDLQNGILIYRRRKTGQKLFVKWEKCMQELILKYPTGDSPYLLPIIKKPGIDERKQYLYTGHNVNRSLKLLGCELGLSMPLTMYVARHAWASIARSKRIPVSIISEAMGHDSEATTNIYLATLDTQAIDKANKRILNLL